MSLPKNIPMMLSGHLKMQLGQIHYLYKTVELAIKCGAKTKYSRYCGYALPNDYERIIKDLFNRVPNIDKVVVSTHTHNDLGLELQML